MDDVKEGAEPVDLVEFPGQCTGQIKSEPINMHISDPVSEAVHDELERAGVSNVE